MAADSGEGPMTVFEPLGGGVDSQEVLQSDLLQAGMAELLKMAVCTGGQSYITDRPIIDGA